MAQTRIADLVPNPGVLSNLVQKAFRTNNALVSSGVAVTGPEVDVLMEGGSQKQALNYVNKIDTTTFNHSSDDFELKGPTGKVTAQEYMALRMDMNWGWAHADLTRMITKYNITSGLKTVIPQYWSEVSENIAIASVKGALATTAALTTGVVTDAFSADALIDAGVGFDDPKAQKTLFVSRRTYAKLQKLNRSTFIPAEERNFNLAKFEGFNVIITEAFGDQKTVIATTGAMVFASGLLPGVTGMQIIEDGNAGNGGGGEILRTRLSTVQSPQGFSFIGAAKPDLATLALAASWTKVAPNDLIGFRAINHAA